MKGARGKETQTNIPVEQNSVYQKLGKKLQLCSLAYIMQCSTSGGDNHTDHSDVVIAMSKTSELHQRFPTKNVCTLQRQQQHLVFFCLVSFVN